jgi:hypothetical protein
MEITKGSEWRKGELVQLPSGKVAMLRSVSLATLVKANNVPNPLLQIASAKIFGTQIQLKMDEETVKSALQLIDLICQAAFLEPKIVDDPKEENEISLMDVSDEDKEFAYEWAVSAQKPLESFRPEPEESVENLPALQEQ